MKITVAEYESQLELADSLTGAAREKIEAALKTAEVVDDQGNPVTVRVVGKAAPAPEVKPTMTDEDVIRVAKAVAKGMADSQPKPAAPISPTIEVKGSIIPPEVNTYASVKNFSGTTAERKEKAYKFGCFLLGGVFGMKKYADRCRELGITITKAQNEGTNTAGGALVPDQIETDIIDLREQYGVFRRNARVVPMVRDVMIVPRRTSGVTANFTSEAAAITESEKAWDSVTLTAKKLAALVKMSSEVLEDAIINVADDLAAEIAYAFSLKEDQCGFIGDGTATYGSIVGVTRKLTTVWTDTANSSSGVVIGAGNAMSEITLANFNDVIGLLPEYADGPNTKWYVSRYFWSSVMERLARAAGGVTAMEVRGASQRTFFGYPVEVTQVMPKTDTNSQILAVFGDLSKACTFGDRRQTTISVSDQAYWANDQVGVRGTSRFDINVHDAGDGTNAGPVVALRAAAS